MKRLFFLLVLFLISSSLLAENIVFSLSTESHSKLLKSCYRWISKTELGRWKKGKSVFGTKFNDSLGRNSDAPITYCWENTVGATIGGVGEVYGDYLLRIDFVDDAVLFDRNTNIYSSIDGKTVVPKSMKLGVDTEVVYANYNVNGWPFFQEYIVRSPKAIKSWSLNDEGLKASFKEDLRRIRADELTFDEYHFYRNKFTYPVGRLERNASGAPYYLQHLDKLEKNMDQFWAENTDDLTFTNKEARKSIGSETGTK